MGYTAGRFVVEALRDDHANHILGMRVNSWVSILVFLAALAWFLRQRGKPRSIAPTDGRRTSRGRTGRRGRPTVGRRRACQAGRGRTGRLRPRLAMPTPTTAGMLEPATDAPSPAGR